MLYVRRHTNTSNSVKDMRVYCCNIILLIKVLNDPPWHKHQPENTGLFPFIEDDKIDSNVCWQQKIKYCLEL